jgi:hypothetical protein
MTSNPKLIPFAMSTSWIPGENHKGFFRYRVTTLDFGLQGDELSTYIGKLHDCRFFLQLDDFQGFKLRSFEVLFSTTQDASGQLHSMIANDMAQMDLSEYKTLINGGDWTISWIKDGSCQ